MAHPPLARLVILPAIVLAAAVSLAGCADQPVPGGDADSRSDSETELSHGCPQKFLDKAEAGGTAVGLEFDSLTVVSMATSDFEPAAVTDLIEGGCAITVTYEADGVSGTMYQAFVSGGDQLEGDINAAIIADRWEDLGGGFYLKGIEYVVVGSNEDAGITVQAADELGLGYLGDEFVVVTTYAAS